MKLDLEKEALIASGIKDDDQIRVYQEKFHYLYERFTSRDAISRDPLTRAKQIFDWLWKVKPSRYASHGSYKLTDVIDAQIIKDSKAIGNCLGLTVLYNCLLQRTGLEPKALHVENAFDMGPHVLTLLRKKHARIDIENIFAEGFDYKGHLNTPMRTVWGDRELVADIYHSQGNESFEKEDFQAALKNYKRAINLNPSYQKAHFNLSILLDKMKKQGSYAGSRVHGS
ncbi:MAG: tetratricopeptide repeat protein [Deltaproteobacteria bacterium]|nr:tetratricopeptide repeat protein [Deltaproteobacteria bacterium]